MASASWTEAEGRYTFHSRCGNLARISNGARTAERRRPFSEFNNAVVISSSPLKEGLTFEIRVEKKVTTWSGSILLGESFRQARGCVCLIGGEEAERALIGAHSGHFIVVSIAKRKRYSLVHETTFIGGRRSDQSFHLVPSQESQPRLLTRSAFLQVYPASRHPPLGSSMASASGKMAKKRYSHMVHNDWRHCLRVKLWAWSGGRAVCTFS